MRKAKVSRAAYKTFDGERWNAYNELLAMSNIDELSPVQRMAYLAYWYCSEVENGGHDQYFGNQSHFNQEEVIAALREIGAEAQADILAQACVIERSITAGDYVETADEDSFPLRRLDLAFANCPKPIIPDLLATYLDNHEAEFIEWVP